MSKSVTGVEAIVRAIGKATSETAIKIDEGLQKCGAVILKKALYYCPVDTEALRKSGRVEVTGKGFGAKVSIVFGGDTAPYSLYVHENLEANHAAPTCAKFLERAVRETRGTCTSIIKRTLAGSFTAHVDGASETL